MILLESKATEKYQKSGRKAKEKIRKRHREVTIMRDNTVHVRRGKKHPSRMEMIVLAALAALMVSGGTLLLLAALLGQDITDWNHRAAITAGLSLAGVVWGWLIRANR